MKKIKQKLSWKFLRNFLIIVIVVFTIGIVTVIAGTPPTAKYNPGETLEPNCAPGATNCTIYAPVASIDGSVGIGSEAAPTFGKALDVQVNNVGSGVLINVANTDNTNSGSYAILRAAVGTKAGGGENAGDPGILLTVWNDPEAGNDWSMAIDNDDGNKLKFRDALWTGDATTVVMTLDPDGNKVGIRTIRPLAPLHVDGGVLVNPGGSKHSVALIAEADPSYDVFGSNMEMRHPDSITGAKTRLGFSAGDHISAMIESVYELTPGTPDVHSGSLALQTRSKTTSMTTALFIDNQQRVGIRTTGPRAPFHVVADDNFAIFERQTTETNTQRTGLDVLHSTTGDMADNFGSMIGFTIRDAVGAIDKTVGRFGAVRNGLDTEGAFLWTAATNGLEKLMMLSGTSLYPWADDLLALGIANTNEWSDLFLNSAAVIGWDNGNYTLTHSAGLLTSNGALAISGALSGVTTLETSGTVTHTLAATDRVRINADITPQTQGFGSLDVGTTTGDDNIIGVVSVVTIGADAHDNATAFQGSLVGPTAGGTLETEIFVFKALMTGNVDDTDIDYVAFNASFIPTGGAGVGTGFQGGEDLTYFLDSMSGNLLFAEYAPVVISEYESDITAATEASSMVFGNNANKTWAAGAGPLAIQREWVFEAPTNLIGNAGGALTISVADVVYIGAPSSAGANMTINGSNSLHTIGNVQFDSSMILAGNTINTPIADATFLAGDTVPSTGTIQRVAGNGAARSLTSTPSIANGIDGVCIKFFGTSASNTLTFRDEDNLANTGLALAGDVDIVIGLGDNFEVCYDSGDDLWRETYRALTIDD